MQANTEFNVDKDPNAEVEVKADISNFVNLAPFPVEFKTPEECLQTYNEYGLWNKIQFKMGYKRFGVKGGHTLYCFHLICACKKYDETKTVQ